MPELILLLLGLAAAGGVVLAPLLRGGDDAPRVDHDAADVRHRMALEALRDVKADRMAGSLDDAAYAEQLADAESRAAATRAQLEAPRPDELPAEPGRGRTAALVAAAAIAALLLAGSVLPATGVANRTAINQSLADAQQAEADRQARIDRLTSALGEDPEDSETLSELADAYLAGSSQDDLVRAAVALQLLIELEPERADSYERIISAYLRAGDHANARAALDAYARLEAADPVEVAFFDGLIALRGEGDLVRAVEAFDEFLELAPDDPRATMVEGLRDEAVGQAD